MVTAPDELESCRLFLSWLVDTDLPPFVWVDPQDVPALHPEARALLPGSLVWELERERNGHEDDSSVLQRSLDWLHQHAGGATLSLEFAALDEFFEFLSGFDLAREVLDRSGRPFDRWFVDDRVLALERPVPGGDHESAPRRLTVFGRSRAEVELAVGSAGSDRRWRPDRMGQPRTDLVHKPRIPWRFRTDAPEGPVSAVLAGRSPTDALEGFVGYWFGLALPPASDGARFPKTYDRLQSLNREFAIFCDHHLIDQKRPDTEDEYDLRGTRAVLVWSECQDVAAAGYRVGDAREDPEALMAADFDESDVPIDAGITVGEFLLRQVIEEASLQSPVIAATSIEATDAATLIGMLDVVYPQVEWLSAVGTIGSAIAVVGRCDLPVTNPQPQVYVRVAAHTREAIAESPLAQFGGWGWTYDSNWSLPSNVGNVVIDWEYDEPDILEGIDPHNFTDEDVATVVDRFWKHLRVEPFEADDSG